MLSDRTTSPGSGPTSGDVLLVFPGRHKAPDPQVPLQLLHVAGALQRAGHRVRIFDMRLADYHSLRIGDPLFVGITAMSGPQIRYGLELARGVRAAKPHVPIVWGGVHPTLLPEQTVASDFVDVVVRGEAELVVGPLAAALAAGAPLDAVNGLTYKADGAIRSTPDADLIDLDTIPVELPYDLLELDRYPTLKAQVPPSGRDSRKASPSPALAARAASGSRKRLTEAMSRASAARLAASSRPKL